MLKIVRLALGGLSIVAFSSVSLAQALATQQSAPPTTKLEGFSPGTGSLLVKGYDTIGTAAYGVSVDAQERTNEKRARVSGLLVEIKELGTSRLEREGRAFVDADEISELLKGLDALLAIKANPTKFKMFEVQYTTRGELALIAFNNDKAEIAYAVKAGRPLGATRYLKAEEMLKLRGLFDSALQKLNAVAPAIK
jgi:hypothetical protein